MVGPIPGRADERKDEGRAGSAIRPTDKTDRQDKQTDKNNNDNDNDRVRRRDDDEVTRYSAGAAVGVMCGRVVVA